MYKEMSMLSFRQKLGVFFQTILLTAPMIILIIFCGIFACIGLIEDKPLDSVETIEFHGNTRGIIGGLAAGLCILTFVLKYKELISRPPDSDEEYVLSADQRESMLRRAERMRKLSLKNDNTKTPPRSDQN